MKERLREKIGKSYSMYEVLFFSSISRSRNQIHIGVCSVFSNRNVSVVGKSQELSCYNFNFSFCCIQRIHQMFSQTCFPNFVYEFFSVWAIEKRNKYPIVPKQFFYSLPVEKEIITNICQKIRRFRIQNWWNYLMSPLWI